MQHHESTSGPGPRSDMLLNLRLHGAPQSEAPSLMSLHDDPVTPSKTPRLTGLLTLQKVRSKTWTYSLLVSCYLSVVPWDEDSVKGRDIKQL
jgi:hypothetical protein